MPETTVLVPCYNYAAYLSECLESILSQTYKDFEVIVLNDCSTDNTEEVAKSFSDSRIRYIRNERNLGNIDNFNKGIRLSSPQAKYLCLISADDKYSPRFLEKAVDKFKRYPEVGMVYPQIVFISEEGKELSRGFHRIPHRKDFKGKELGKLLLSVNHIPSFSIARKECWLEAGPFDIGSKNAGDWLIWLEIARNWESCFINEYLGFRRIHQRSQHRNFMLEKRSESDALYVLDKFYSHNNLPQEAIRVKGKAYANLFISNMLSYLAFGYHRDVRKCFKKAVENNFLSLFNLKALLYFFMSFLTKESINKIKEFRARFGFLNSPI